MELLDPSFCCIIIVQPPMSSPCFQRQVRVTVNTIFRTKLIHASLGVELVGALTPGKLSIFYLKPWPRVHYVKSCFSVWLMEDLDYFDQDPLSPEVVLQGSLGSSENREDFDESSDSSTTSDIVETPKRPVTKKRRRCKGLSCDEDSSSTEKGVLVK